MGQSDQISPTPLPSIFQWSGEVASVGKAAP